MSPFQEMSKTEMKVGSCRAKYEQYVNTKKEAVIEIVKILNQAILEKNYAQVEIIIFTSYFEVDQNILCRPLE